MKRTPTSLASRVTSLDPRRLRYLHEAVSAGSIRAGALRLGTNPSALSRQIAKLEAELGVPLLEKRGRGVLPSEAGSLVLEYFVDMRTRSDTVLSDLQDLASLNTGSVSIALGEGFLADAMRGPLKAFAARHPKLRIDLLVGGTTDIVRQVVNGDAHLGLVYSPPNDQRLHTHVVRSHAIEVVVRKGHRLSYLERDIALDDLRTCDLGVLPGSYGVRQVVLTAEQQGKVRLSPRLVANSSRALLWFAEEWDGVILTAAFAVAHEVEQGRLVTLPFQNQQFASTTVHLVTRRGRRLPSAALALMRDLRSGLECLK